MTKTKSAIGTVTMIVCDICDFQTDDPYYFSSFSISFYHSKELLHKNREWHDENRIDINFDFCSTCAVDVKEAFDPLLKIKDIIQSIKGQV